VPSGPHVEPLSVQRVEEDDPRWDCRTMGNRVCGAPAPIADAVVYSGEVIDCTSAEAADPGHPSWDPCHVRGFNG